MKLNMKNDEATVTDSELAEQLGLTPPRICQLHDMGLPKNKDGRVPLNKALAWYRNNIRDGAHKRGPKSTRPVIARDQDAAARLLKAQADKEEQLAELRAMEVRRRKGELVEVSDVRQAWSQQIVTAQGRLLGIPGKLAPRLVGKTVIEIEEILEKEIRSALTALSEGK